MSVSTSGGNQSADGDEGADPAQRDDEAEQEQQVVGAVENVQEPGADEARRRFVPARVQPDEAGIVVQLEGARGAVGR